jgi:hypothetical protein
LIPFFIVCAISSGLYVDQAFSWGQNVVSLGTWALYLGIVATSPSRVRVSVIICLAYATFGEFILSDVWGLYSYREGHIPLFVPPGHALLYLLGVAVAEKIPRVLTYIVPIAVAPYLAYVVWLGLDTEGLVWFAVFLAFLKWGPNKRLYVTMFVLALIMEIYGTSLGNWTWAPQVPFTPLTSTNPPVTAGVFYCMLDALVIWTTNAYFQRMGIREQERGTESGNALAS